MWRWRRESRATCGKLRIKIHPITVIPAKAGIQLAIDIAVGKLGPGLRRGDGKWVLSNFIDRSML
jgi:hypothetical protein